MFCIVRYNAPDLPRGTRDVWIDSAQWAEQRFIDLGRARPMTFETIVEAREVAVPLSRNIGTVSVERT